MQQISDAYKRRKSMEAIKPEEARKDLLAKLAAIVPHPYQIEDSNLILEYVGRRQNTCYQLPTGGGKTVIFREVIKRLVATKTILFVVPQVELVNQAMDTFADLNPINMQNLTKFSKWQPGNLFIGCREKTMNHIKLLPKIDVVLVDEAHRSVGQIQRLIKKLGYRPIVIGLTATPENFQLVDSGMTMADLYGSICKQTTINKLIEEKWLVPIDYKWYEFDLSGIKIVNGDYDMIEVAKRIDRQKLIVDCGLWLKENPSASSCLFFMPTIKSAVSNCDYMNSLGIGKFEHVEADMALWKRKIIYDEFKSGKIRGIFSRDILTYGFDAPIANCGLCFRPIKKSRALYLQILGRVTRLHKESGKKSAVFYDYVNNASRFHGEYGELYTDMKYNPDWNFFGVEQKRHYKDSSKKDSKVNTICPLTEEKCVSHKCRVLPDKIEKWFEDQDLVIPACCFVKTYLDLRDREDELGVPHAIILPRQELAKKSVLYGRKPSRKKAI
jgi:superfamily II DNA or RNA helicase